jgi:ATP-dependent DNA ligase
MFVAIVGAIIVLLLYHTVFGRNRVRGHSGFGSLRRHRSPMPRRPSDPLPDFIAPQLATLVQRPPEGDTWLHEVKIDGYRVAARIERGDVRTLRTGSAGRLLGI